MLGSLIKNQVLENIYGIKFIITFVICSILVTGATISGIGRYDQQIREEKDIISTNRSDLEEAGRWRDVGREGIKIVKPATRLSIFSSGLEESVGRTATVKEGDFPHMEDSIYSTAPIFAIFGDLDLTFIIKIVISLFAILFTYDLISGERERGTLKLCLSNSVPRNTFILGKSIGSFISLLIPLVIPLIIGMLIMITIGNITFTGDEWIRLSLMLVGYVLYMLSFFCLGVFVSTMTRNSAISFLILLFVWVLFVLVIPKGAMMLADQVYPIPSLNEVRAEQSQLNQEFRSTLWTKTVEEFLATGGANLQGSQRWIRMRAIRSEIREKLEKDYLSKNEKLVSDFKQQQENLTNLAMVISRISPASAITYIGMNLSGTGFREQENFLRLLTKYRKDFTGFLDLQIKKEEQDAARNRSMMSHGPTAEGKLDLSALPPFKYTHLSLAESFSLVMVDMLMLSIISIVFYLLGFILFLRYDVR